MRRILRGILPVAVLVAVTGASVPAQAAKPLKEVFIDQGIFTLPDVDCGTFTLHEEMTSEHVTTITTFDRAGDPLTVATHANFFGVVTNSLTGETFRDHVAFTETLQLAEGATTVSGSSFHFVDAGSGQVYAEVGHKVIVSATGEVTFQAGQDDFVQTDLQGLCEPLA